MPVNYRPISLTSVCCKVMEHIIYHSIMSHLEKNNIINSFQHGFRSGHSCTTQLLTDIEELANSIHVDIHKQVDVLFLDFPKDFDTVPTNACLRNCNIVELMTRYIAGFLNGRQNEHRVLVNGKNLILFQLFLVSHKVLY